MIATEQLRDVAVALHTALDSLRPVHDLVAPGDRATVRDLRWTIAEAQRLNRLFRRQLDDRLAGATTRLQPTSLHDPPDARPAIQATAEGTRTTPP